MATGMAIADRRSSPRETKRIEINNDTVVNPHFEVHAHFEIIPSDRGVSESTVEGQIWAKRKSFEFQLKAEFPHRQMWSKYLEIDVYLPIDKLVNLISGVLQVSEKEEREHLRGFFNELQWKILTEFQASPEFRKFSKPPDPVAA